MFTLINSVMLVIGFAVSAMFIVFVCTRLICARIQLNASRRSSIPTAVTVHRFDISHMDRGLRGLDPVLVATFPTKKYRDGVFSYGEDSQCVVCLAEYQEKDMLRILPYCQHCFHVNCIDAWLQQHSTCPVCRISLRISPERKCAMQPMFSLAVRSSSVSTLNMNTYNNNLYTSPGFSSRSFSNPRMEPIQEDRVASELDAAENGESSFTDDDQVQKDVDHHDSDIIMSRVHPVHTSP